MEFNIGDKIIPISSEGKLPNGLIISSDSENYEVKWIAKWCLIKEPYSDWIGKGLMTYEKIEIENLFKRCPQQVRDDKLKDIFN